jgi:hypothetical protein
MAPTATFGDAFLLSSQGKTEGYVMDLALFDFP